MFLTPKFVSSPAGEGMGSSMPSARHHAYKYKTKKGGINAWFTFSLRFSLYNCRQLEADDALVCSLHFVRCNTSNSA